MSAAALSAAALSAAALSAAALSATALSATALSATALSAIMASSLASLPSWPSDLWPSPKIIIFWEFAIKSIINFFPTWVKSTSSPSIVTKYVPSSNGVTESEVNVIVIWPSNLVSIIIFTALWFSSLVIESTIPPRIVYFRLSLSEVCGAACGVTLGCVAAGVGGGEYVCVGAAILGVEEEVSTCNNPPIIAIIAAAKAIVKIIPNLSTPAMFMIFTGILNI